jgi:hypothetical protein
MTIKIVRGEDSKSVNLGQSLWVYIIEKKEKQEAITWLI